MNEGIIGWVRIIGFLEGLSAFALFIIAMPMKYIWDTISKENFFHIGMTHGVLWVAYSLVATAALLLKKLTFKHYLLLAFFSLLPLGPIAADRYVLKRVVSRDDDAIV